MKHDIAVSDELKSSKYSAPWWTEHDKKQYNAHNHTTFTDVTPFSFLQYCQQHKVKHCVLTTVANTINYGVTFFWILSKKEMSVTFLNVKKSKQKPPGGV